MTGLTCRWREERVERKRSKAAPCSVAVFDSHFPSFLLLSEHPVVGFAVELKRRRVLWKWRRVLWNTPL